ncbi:GNAT family N-acetyltransferase [Phenylobacterium sp. LH3H17]|uniref:GNAT family N-acetyltransferase n=1 Tax=Phenylobacterium sp. LH3H17 TaxID=2903901 RepID=UPI0020C973A8|nr:GNAT family N-acetyltransferase [Phenylobacterium sp. LH3H17]UTP40323.1 GNAT family N-acetyltransferase [Phenylobacterium sp. LH3H17]
MTADLRPLKPADLAAAAALQDAVYLPLYREPAEILVSRLEIAPTCCWGAFGDDRLMAYVLSHPWPAAAPPAIGTALGAPPPGDNWFVHDLAIGEAARGLGLGRALVRRAADAALALGLVRGDLIAVQGAGGFWARMGYADPPDLPAALAAKVAGYGPDARYMTVRLADLKA